MLHWQPKKWFEQLSLKVKIILGSVFCHALVLFSLFVVYRGNEQFNILITGTMINTDVPIVFMPMHKSLKKYGGPSSVSQGGASSHSRQNSADTSHSKKQTVALSVPEPKAKKKSAQKNKKTKKETSAKKDAVLKKTKNEKKTAQGASPEPKKEKLEPKPEAEILKPIAEAKINTEELKAVAPAIAQNADIPGDQNVLYLGQQEMDALQVQDYIQQEMAQHWSPPAGMRSDISCVLKISVAFDGAIKNLEIDKSSGVMLFDDAAKRASWKLTPPQWAYGKELTVTFKP